MVVSEHRGVIGVLAWTAYRTLLTTGPVMEWSIGAKSAADQFTKYRIWSVLNRNAPHLSRMIDHRVSLSAGCLVVLALSVTVEERDSAVLHVRFAIGHDPSSGDRMQFACRPQSGPLTS
jgi:hypothetical protein